MAKELKQCTVETACHLEQILANHRATAQRLEGKDAYSSILMKEKKEKT